MVVLLEFIAEIGAVNKIENQCRFDETVTVRISIDQGIVEAIGITVEVLREIRGLDVVVRAEHAGSDRVVETPVHVDEVELWQHLVACIAAMEINRITVGCLIAPCIIGSMESNWEIIFSSWAPKSDNISYLCIRLANKDAR